MCIGRTTCRFKKRVEKRQTHRSVDALITRRLKALIKPVEQEQGLSLVEIVVSVMLLGLMATGLLAAIDAGFRASLAIEDQTTSANLVTSQLEDILARAYVEPADYPTVELPDGFSLSFDNFVIVPTLLERITIAVSNAVEELFSITTRKVNTAFVASPPTQLLSQREFRWYKNNASTTPVTSLADQSTSFTISTNGQTVRLRMSVQVLTVALDTSTQAFRLQYSTDTGGPWADVGAFASTTSTWIGFNNPGVADGDGNSSPLLSTSDVFESYEEENPSVSNPRAVSADDVAEWDWVLQENAAAFNTNYFFRMVEEDGTELGSYTRFPVLAMPPPISYDQFDYRWYQNADSITPGPALASQRVALATTTRYEAYRLRMNVAVDGIALDTSTQAFRLQYATSTLARIHRRTPMDGVRTAEGGG